MDMMFQLVKLEYPIQQIHCIGNINRRLVVNFVFLLAKIFCDLCKGMRIRALRRSERALNFFTFLVPVRLLLRTAEPQNNEPQNFEGMYSGNFIKNRAKRFHTSIFDIHLIDIRYSQF
jgi:hypothetical protein